jgi:twitching motility protein PilT
MATPGTAPISVSLDPAVGSNTDTDALLGAMLRAYDQVSDLIFSPGRLPQVEVHGQLLTIQASGLRGLTADDTRRIASSLIGHNKHAITILREQGSCDVSYGLAGVARFRVNVFIQRGSCAVVMRVIPTNLPTLVELGLPSHLGELVNFRDGIVLITGPRGSGKSSTLAALLDYINQRQSCHIITIEDPIEFLHNHKRATVHQRELHSDTQSIAAALRAALRQAPNVILLGELRDRETMELALEAAETGHLVLSSLNTIDAAQTVDRIVNAFQPPEHAAIRTRLGKTLRCVVSQRLIPRRQAAGRTPIVEILRFDTNRQEYIEASGFSSEALLQVMKNGSTEGMQHLDGEIEKLIRAGTVDPAIALQYARDPQALRDKLRDLRLLVPD